MKQSFLRLVWFIPLVSSSVVVACSAPPSGPSTGEDTAALDQACSKPQPICRDVKLDATKRYAPASHTDGTASVNPSMKFDLPHVLPVTKGASGHGSATLTLRDGSRTTVCTYRADDDCDSHGHGKRQYRLDRCDHHVGEDVTATSITLHIVDGDSHDAAHETDVSITLREEDCQHGTPDAGAPPDAGPPPPPDTGPACDPAQCDDGNPCTDDSCGAGGACVHANDDANACDDGNTCTSDSCSAGKCVGAAVPDGTQCYAGDLCIFPASQTCTAGACGAGMGACGGSECASTTCDSSSGVCGSSPAGTPCSGGACDGSGACTAGASPAANVTFLPAVCPPQTSFSCAATTGTFNAAEGGCLYAPLAAGTACATGVCDGATNCVASTTNTGTSGPGIALLAACASPSACTLPGSIDLEVGACAYVDVAAGTACGAGKTCDGHGACTP